jgi:hypothetical protein
MTVSMLPNGSGNAGFFNPQLGFRCLGALTWGGQSSYAYKLQVDHSSSPGLCALYGTIIMTPGPGYVGVSFYQQTNPKPSFSANLGAWI